MEMKIYYSRLELKKKLIELKQSRFKQCNDFEEIIKNMLFYIGDQESGLRDKMIYSTFSEVILNTSLLSEPKLKEILNVVVDDEHLFYKIGNYNDTTVLTRSFSVLVVALILNRNNTNKFLSKNEVEDIKIKLFKYFEEEKDYRGYDESYGWIHAIAHCSDALDEYVLSNECTHDDCKKILELGFIVFTNPTHIFTHEEDERFANVISTMKNRNLVSAIEIDTWKDGLKLAEDYSAYTSFISRINGKQLWRSLFFREK